MSYKNVRYQEDSRRRRLYININYHYYIIVKTIYTWEISKFWVENVKNFWVIKLYFILFSILILIFILIYLLSCAALFPYFDLDSHHRRRRRRRRRDRPATPLVCRLGFVQDFVVRAQCPAGNTQRSFLGFAHEI
jgi:hypothetical protein